VAYDRKYVPKYLNLEMMILFMSSEIAARMKVAVRQQKAAPRVQ
jgi:hypothetical protein